MKKTILYLTASFVLLYILPGCHKKNDTTTTPLTGSWTASTDFEGVARSNAVAFTINNMAYVGTGFNGTIRKNDFWEFDVTTQSWQQVANVPGVPREKAAGFCVGDTGYLGSGYDGVNLLDDFYAYDPVTDSWFTKPTFQDPINSASLARLGAVGFAIDTTGFIASGFDGNYKNDVYKYTPSRSVWTKMASLPKKTSYAVAFVIDTVYYSGSNSRAYVCSGINNGLLVSEVSEYNPISDVWTAKTNLTTDHDIRRSGASGFTLNGLGYLTCGSSGSSVSASTWSFNPSSNAWTQMNDMSGGGRMDAVAFTVNNRAFISTGRNNNLRFDDLWEFKP